MKTNRLEAFSDGVIAIVITIMVLELDVPHGTDWRDLLPLLPVLGSYVLSFVYVAIYWNNHHHLFQAAEHVNGATLWANLHWLFWLSLLPFTSAWMGERGFTPWPVAAYGLDLLATAVAYVVLTRTLVQHHGGKSRIARSIGSDAKGKRSIALYFVAIGIAFWQPWLACLIYAAVAAIWFIPDRRIETRA